MNQGRKLCVYNIKWAIHKLHTHLLTALLGRHDDSIHRVDTRIELIARGLQRGILQNMKVSNQSFCVYGEREGTNRKHSYT